MAEIDKPTDRRRLLRRAGTLAAGVAGAGVAGGVAATPARADQGDPVIQGENNDAGNTTGLTIHSPSGATLELRNTFEVPESREAGPALRLVPLGDSLYDEIPAGSLSADRLGIPWVSVLVQDPSLTFSYQVHTDFNSNTTVPIIPTRVVDTRNAAGRTRILNRSVLDSAGRLLKGQTMHVNLGDIAFFPDAVLLNATVTGQVTAGYLTVYGFGSARPGVASINYSPNENLSNFVFTASGEDSANLADAAISVYSSQLAHVVLDVVGFVVSSGGINPAVIPTTLAAGGAKRTDATARREQAMRGRKPAWK
jgi:hypothetical protein